MKMKRKQAPLFKSSYEEAEPFRKFQFTKIVSKFVINF